MPGEPDYYLDLQGLSADPEPSAPAGGLPARKWIGIHFECCGAYTRIYRNHDGTAYEGHCPRCTRFVRVRVGANGTPHRMFRAR